MLQITINSEAELLQLCRELFHTLVNLRKSTSDWQEYHGSVLLEQKRKWEIRADTLIDKYKMESTDSSHCIEIEVVGNGEEKQQRGNRWRQKSESLHELVVDKYLLQAIKLDEFNWYWDVSYDGIRIANCDKDKTPTTIKQAKDAARWRMEKHKDSLIKKPENQ